MALDPMTLTASDGETLEAECALPSDGAPPRAAMVLCHPHPLQGGTMRSIVISALFNALPDSGVACLRFNFRGVEGSSGVHDEGGAERFDALAAIGALAGAVPSGTPLLLTGWSFGADVALSVHDQRIAAWLAIAGPLRFVRDPEVIAADPRPKVLALAERDEVRPPTEIEAEVQPWTNTRTVTIPGASHFFIGRTDQLVVVARDLVDEVAAGSSG
jgi:alpha/beta superfamily hydrolase